MPVYVTTKCNIESTLISGHFELYIVKCPKPGSQRILKSILRNRWRKKHIRIAI